MEINPVSRNVWDMKYRFTGGSDRPGDGSIEDTWTRIAEALAVPEIEALRWAREFLVAMGDFKFIPGGRIVAGAGTGRKVTLFNCFVMDAIADDLGDIFANLRASALTMQQGGGIGMDFSTLRPKGARVKSIDASASGPLSFMDVWDSMCRTIMSAGTRRGAMMGTLRCDHPDIEAFIEAKRDPARLRMFNLSVLVTDAFMEAVKADADWDLVFGGVVFKTVCARELWDRILKGTYACAEPGVIFIDRINRLNNLYYCETIQATNPCGEVPLPPYGACLLGSLNLARLVRDPFTDEAGIDLDELSSLVLVAVRALDNVIDISGFPLEEQEHEAKAKRRLGLGVTGLADALIMCKVRYGSPEAVALTEKWMRQIQYAAYFASIGIAKEKGPFPLFDREKYLGGVTIQEMPKEIRDGIAKHGIRNALLTSIAPTGTISLFADNVSSGLEPVFAFEAKRGMLQPDGSRVTVTVCDYAYRLFMEMHPGTPVETLPDYLVTAADLTPAEHVAMQAAAQKFICNSISKTINCPEDMSFEEFKEVYALAYDSGCKGCTTFRPNDVTGAVLEAVAPVPPAKGDINDEGRVNDAPVSAAPDERRQDELPVPATAGHRESRPNDVRGAAAGVATMGNLVHLSQPLKRPAWLPGRTYKIKTPASEHALYVTINDVKVDDRVRPFEIFVNSKDMEAYPWIIGLTLMISAVFRRGGDVAFVCDELQAVFDPMGGQWIPSDEPGGKSKRVPSVVALLGHVLKQHMEAIGFLMEEGHKGDSPAQGAPNPVAMLPWQALPGRPAGLPIKGGKSSVRMRQCPKCALPALVRIENCDQCTECNYSKC